MSHLVLDKKEEVGREVKLKQVAVDITTLKGVEVSRWADALATKDSTTIEEAMVVLKTRETIIPRI
jgi:hypothetical protein